jgi:moderate conductance mechanosensitive channel
MNEAFLQAFPPWFLPVTAVLLALGIAWLVASLAARAIRAAMHGILGRDAFSTAEAQAITPVRVIRLTVFLLLAALLVFPALDLAGRGTEVGVEAQALGAWFFVSGMRVVLIVVLSWLLVRIIGGAVARLEIEAARGTSLDAIERSKRVRTLGNLVYNTIGVVVGVAAVLMVLRELDVDILPLLTGAGIVGLAIGFGAQSLVKDVISGFFLIFENQVRVGDVANINGTGGLVEAITMRTVVLRDLNGTVHVFPNGSINTLANLTKDFSFAVLDVGVAYKEDTDRVVEVLRAAGAELHEDERVGPSIMAPLEVLGVDAFAESAVVLRVRFKTLPLKQWEVAREFRRRVKQAFDREGIEFPYPHVTLYAGSATTPFPVTVTEPGAGRRASGAGPGAAPRDPGGSR